MALKEASLLLCSREVPWGSVLAGQAQETSESGVSVSGVPYLQYNTVRLHTMLQRCVLWGVQQPPLDATPEATIQVQRLDPGEEGNKQDDFNLPGPISQPIEGNLEPREVQLSATT